MRIILVIMKLILHKAVLLSLSVLASGCVTLGTERTGTSDSSSSTEPAQLAAVKWRDVESATLKREDRNRKYFYYEPRAEISSDKIPVVIALHGGASHPKNIMRRSKLADLAREQNFLAVFPQGSGPLGRLLTWNAGGCCGKAVIRGIDDVGFISELIIKLINEHNVDSDRVYITGFSNGGMLSYRLGCNLSEQITAIAPIAAVMPDPKFSEPCNPTRPVPIIVFHGLADPRVLYSGSEETESKRLRISVPDSVNVWAQINECGDSVTRSGSGFSLISYEQCLADVRFYTVNDLGHRWPGWDRRLLGGRPDPQASIVVDASTVMWQFFEPLRK